jgi:DNA mismatch endonuclease (patch repair protein)
MIRDPAVTSRIMASIGNRDTGPELLLRRELHRRGLRYRVRTRLPGKPDLVFAGPRVAVFVDGDYWHGNTWRLRGYSSFDAYFDTVTNGDFWRAKIGGNMRRDQQVSDRLTADGWQVIRLWESTLRRAVDPCANSIELAVRRAQRNTLGTAS